jgi:hypothetical protein
VIQFALQPANQIFAGALGLMIGIALVELIGLMLGGSVAEFIGGVAGDADAEMPDGVALPDDAEGPWAALLGWLYVGKAPVLILVVGFLLGFGLAGLAIQSILASALGAPVPGLVAALPALVAALPATRLIGRGFARVFPKEETYAVSEASFIGLVATVTLGTASAGQPAEAKLHDRHGRAHYVRIAPDLPDDRFPTGSRVLLVRKVGTVFHAIAADASPGLADPAP